MGNSSSIEWEREKLARLEAMEKEKLAIEKEKQTRLEAMEKEKLARLEAIEKEKLAIEKEKLAQQERFNRPYDGKIHHSLPILNSWLLTLLSQKISFFLHDSEI